MDNINNLLPIGTKLYSLGVFETGKQGIGIYATFDYTIKPIELEVKEIKIGRANALEESAETYGPLADGDDSITYVTKRTDETTVGATGYFSPNGDHLVSHLFRAKMQQKAYFSIDELKDYADEFLRAVKMNYKSINSVQLDDSLK